MCLVKCSNILFSVLFIYFILLYHSIVSWNLLIKQIMINTSFIYEYVRRINSCRTIFLCCLSFLILILILNGSSFLLIYSYKTPSFYSSLFLFLIYFFFGKLLLNSHGGVWEFSFGDSCEHQFEYWHQLQLSDRGTLAQFFHGRSFFYVFY